MKNFYPVAVVLFVLLLVSALGVAYEPPTDIPQEPTVTAEAMAALTTPAEPAPVVGRLPTQPPPQLAPPQPVKTVDVEAYREALAADAERRQKACVAEVGAILKKYDCVIAVAMILTPNAITPDIRIVPNEQPGQ